MADRQWNAVDASLYDQRWTRGARRVFAHLIAICPNQYGIFDFPLGRLCDHWEDVYTPDQMDGFVREWVNAGAVRLYRNDTLIWIVKKFKREQGSIKAPNHLTGLRTFISRYPELESDFYDIYMTFRLNPDEIQMPLSESDTDSEPEKKKKNESINPRLSPAVDWPAKLAELEAKLPDQCALSWESLKEARANENPSGKVSTSVLAKLLEQILAGADDLTPDALNYGMSKGIPNPRYVIKTAGGYKQPHERANGIFDPTDDGWDGKYAT